MFDKVKRAFLAEHTTCKGFVKGQDLQLLEQIEKARIKLSGGLPAKIKVDCLVGDVGIDQPLSIEDFVSFTEAYLNEVHELLEESRDDLDRTL